MFTPNARGHWLKKAAKRTLTGKETFSAPRLIPLSVVTLKDTTVLTTVRADSSASRGAAQQQEASAVFLIPPQYPVARGDLIRISGMTVEIAGIEVRRDIFGKIDHYEVVANHRSED